MAPAVFKTVRWALTRPWWVRFLHAPASSKINGHLRHEMRAGGIYFNVEPEMRCNEDEARISGQYMNS